MRPHCSADGSGVTTWLDNVTRISPEAGDDPRPWLAPIASGNDHVLTFLHEATHNWCFGSKVGEAQVCLVARAQLNAWVYTMLDEDPEEWEDGAPRFLRDAGMMLRAIDGDPRGQFGDGLEEVRQRLAGQVFEDILRLEVIDELFRPLAEGLALFAEYDGVTGPLSRAVSPVLASLAYNFQSSQNWARYARRGAGTHETLVGLLADVVEDARLSEFAVTTKATVLGAPFASTEGGYLPGYLTVKSMCRSLAAKAPRLAVETDLALLYIRNFFYEDVALAAELLAPPQGDAVAGANRLISHFAGRLEAFYQVKGPEIGLFEDYQEGEHDAAWFGLRYLEEEYREASELMAERLDGLRTSPAGEISDFVLRHVVEETNLLLQRRKVVTVMSVPVDVGADLAVTWQGHRILTVDAADVLNAGIGPATMDILLGMAGGSQTMNRVAVLSRDKEIHSITVILAAPGQEETVRAATAAWFSPRAARESMSEIMKYVPETLVSAEISHRLNREHVRAALPKIVDGLYAPAVLFRCSSPAVEQECADLMAEKGLRPLLGSVEMVRGAAFLGLLASVNPSAEMAESVFRDRGLNLDELLTRLDEATTRYEFPPPACQPNGRLTPCF